MKKSFLLFLSLLILSKQVEVDFDNLFQNYEFDINLKYTNGNDTITITKAKGFSIFNDLFGKPDSLKAKIFYKSEGKITTTGFVRVLVNKQFLFSSILNSTSQIAKIINLSISSPYLIFLYKTILLLKEFNEN
jgi:hypothetical protein